MLTQPRLFLVPHLTELEWVIKPELEEWAEVATFDVPGVGAEPAAEPLDRQAIINRALVELDRRGWDSYILSTDASLFAAITSESTKPGDFPVRA